MKLFYRLLFLFALLAGFSAVTRAQLGVDPNDSALIKKYADFDFNVTKPRALGEPDGSNYLPLAPVLTTTGGLTYSGKNGLSGSLRYRYMGNRPANEDNSVVAKGYLVTDAVVNYTRTKYEVALSIQNLFNVKWKETQFDTESRLFNEPNPVSEIHFTPGIPFFAKLGISYNF